MILSIDTSLGSAVAVVDLDGTVLAEVGTDDRLGHAEVIGDLMLRVLAEAGNPEITHVAAGMGPGPFTGLRIGIAAARTFALARNALLVPVVSHDAIALALAVPISILAEMVISSLFIFRAGFNKKFMHCI